MIFFADNEDDENEEEDDEDDLPTVKDVAVSFFKPFQLWYQGYIALNLKNIGLALIFRITRPLDSR